MPKMPRHAVACRGISRHISAMHTDTDTETDTETDSDSDTDTDSDTAALPPKRLTAKKRFAQKQIKEKKKRCLPERKSIILPRNMSVPLCGMRHPHAARHIRLAASLLYSLHDPKEKSPVWGFFLWDQTAPCAFIASATLRKPAMFAPATRSSPRPYSFAALMEASKMFFMMVFSFSSTSSALQL